jgi:uncharacterized alpha/beta hydrolase family protein
MNNSNVRASKSWGKCLAVSVTAIAVSGCVFKDVKTQQAAVDALCTISGTVTAQGESALPIVVGLARHKGGDINTPQNWALADHFVLENAGRWVFKVSPGSYGLVAFEDRNSDGIYQPTEPFLRSEPDKVLQCHASERLVDLKLTIPPQGRSRLEGPINFAEFQARTFTDQTQISLGQLTVYGQVTTFDDPKFAYDVAADSLWRPYDFAVNVGPGVYFLEKYDPKKIPVLFVHGMNGTPNNFKTLITRMDRSKYQAFVYYYPSGAHLDAVADHLDQTMKALQLEYGFTKHYVVAHSIGGLVSRGYISRNQTAQSRVKIPLYITISTPWGGIKSAEGGVKHAPAVVRAWNDIVPNSPYIQSIFFKNAGSQERRELPEDMQQHLLFAFKDDSRGECTDGTVSVASQLDINAQSDAVRLYGFDETHVSILESEAVSKLINGLLDDAK